MMARMKDKPNAPRRFHMHETARMHAPEGLPLATIWQRLLGYVIDVFWQYCCGLRWSFACGVTCYIRPLST